MKIVKYTLIIWESLSLLEERVNESIEDGWEPYGSPYVNGAKTIQPMVKYERGIYGG